MQNNARLAKLILSQIQGDKTDTNWDGRELEISELLDEALQDGRSRLDLRDKLFAGARATNAFTPKDITEVMTQNLSDQIRDLDQIIAELENDMLPSRLVMGSLIGLVLGATGALIYGSTDLITSVIVTAVMASAFLITRTFRNRALGIILGFKVRRANYDSFRVLLRDSE